MIQAPLQLSSAKVGGGALLHFSRLLQAVARDLEYKGQPLWTQASLEPGALTKAYPDADMVLAWQGSEAVGGMVIVDDDAHFWPDIETGKSLFVHKLAVLPAARSSGVASRLLAFAHTEAKAQGKQYLRLDCAAERPRLRRFYKRQGFTFVGERTVGTFQAALYEKKLA